LEQVRNLKNGLVPYLGLEITIHVIKSKILLVRQSPMENPDYCTVHFAHFLHSFSVSLHWSMVRKLLAEPFSSRDGGGGPVTEPAPCPPRYQMNMPPDIEDIERYSIYSERKLGYYM
jgi:hypothetical protein